MGWVEFYEGAVHGFVDLALGHASGLRPARVGRRAARDGWDPQPGGGWRLPSHEETGPFRLVAAVRGAGPDAVADRHSALALHGIISSYPTKPQLLLPHESRSRRLRDVEVRRTRRLLADHVTEVEGIPCVTVARAIADLSPVLNTSALRSLALAGARTRQVSPDELLDVLGAMPRNLPGRGRLREVVHDLQSDGSDSGFEFRTREGLQRVGLRPDRDQPTVVVAGTRRRIDIAWVALRVGVECQSYRFHGSPDALDRDARRLNGLASEGDWIILQLTPTMLHDGWEAFLADLRRSLARRATDLGLPLPAGVHAA